MHQAPRDDDVKAVRGFSAGISNKDLGVKAEVLRVRQGELFW